MKMCQQHWDMCREAISTRGMDGLVAKSGEEAAEHMVEELKGGKAPFDPLMSMHWHWTNEALRNGGLYLMGVDEDGNPYCPICEFEKHMTGFDAARDIGMIADQMQAHARAEGLIARQS